jgi:hypothetical protein
MNIQTLDKIFKPQRVALLGVSPNPKSVCGRILANLIGGGFRGVVYPVSPSIEAVMGIPSGKPIRPHLHRCKGSQYSEYSFAFDASHLQPPRLANKPGYSSLETSRARPSRSRRS